MGPLLALTSALFYGISDFAGGLLSRRAHFAVVAAVGQIGGLVFTVAVATVVGSSGVPAPVDLAWGALSGIGTGVGMVFLFRGLSRGAMSVVVPISAVCGIAVPVLMGVAALGERPSTLSWLGIVIAVPALWLVAQTGTHAGPALPVAARDGLIAGLGIAVQYVALAQAGAGSGLWPVAAGRVAAILTVVPLLSTAGGTHIRWSLVPALAAGFTGAAAALALIAYLLATREQLAVVAVVLSSLYPVVPVLLGVTVLRERLIPRQAAGLLVAASAVALLATS